MARKYMWMASFVSLSFSLALLLVCIPKAAAASAPPVMGLGGLFAPVSPSGQRDLAQAEHLAAFVMAVNHINDKTDGIHDDLLPDTHLTYNIQGSPSLIGATKAFFGLIESFNSAPLFSVVSALDNEDMLLISELASKTGTHLMTTVFDSGQCYETRFCQTTSNVAALQSREGVAIQNLICLFTNRLVIFVGTGIEDINAMSEFTDESVCTLDIFANIVIRSELSDFAAEIARAKSFGARSFVFFLPAWQVAGLLEQGYAAGLFHEGIVISMTSRGVANITEYFSPDADVPRLMMSTFSYHYTPDFFMNKTAEAISFADRWRKQPHTAGQMVNGEMVCSSAVDGDGDFYLYKAVDPVTNRTVCTGLNFSEYDQLGFSIQSHTGLTYDATIVAAMALDFAIRNELDYSDYAVIQDIMINNVTYAAVTGPFILSKGFEQFQQAGRNTRVGGTIYKITNFNPTVYSSGLTNEKEFMVPIGYFRTYYRTFEFCGAFGPNCFPPVFSSATDGSQYVVPLTFNPTISVKLPVAYSAIFQVMSSILVFLVLAFGLFVVVNRRAKVVKASQPTLLVCILVGGLLGAARISVGGTDKSDELCTVEFWVGHLAFIIMIGSLFVKSYRVHRIVNTKGLRHVTFSAFDAFKLLVAVTCVAIVYLIVASSVGKPGMRYLRSVQANQETHWKYCSMEYPQFQTALFAMEFIFLTTGFRVCWEIRNVPDIVNESKQISTAMSSIVLVSVLIMPIVYFLGLPPYTTELIASLGFGFGAIVTLLLLFVPKLAAVYGGGGAAASRISAKVHPDSSKKRYGGGGDGDHSATTDEELEKCLKGKSKEERLVICQDQLRRWQVLLLDQQRALMNSTSSNPRDGCSSDFTGGLRKEPSSAPMALECSDGFSATGSSLPTGTPLFRTLTACSPGGRLKAQGSDSGLMVQDV
jgi:hypothetical protein